MRTIATALVALALVACGSDDTPEDGVDGGGSDTAADLTGTFAASWSCQTPNACVTPLENDTLVSITEVGGEVRISWAYDGALAPSSIHVGSHLDPNCAAIALGADEGVDRQQYTLCVDPNAVGALTAVMTWSVPTVGDSTWRVDLVRY